MMYTWCFVGEKVAEDARLTRDDLPALYTLSRDGALFSWAYDREEEALHTRKKQRLITSNPADAEAIELSDAETEAAGNPPEDARQASFSGGLLVYPAWRAGATAPKMDTSSACI